MNYNFVSFVAAQNASTSRINMEGLPSGWTLQVSVTPINHSSWSSPINHQSFDLEQPNQSSKSFDLEQPNQSSIIRFGSAQSIAHIGAASLTVHLGASQGTIYRCRCSSITLHFHFGAA
jgi:hypothetical protein